MSEFQGIVSQVYEATRTVRHRIIMEIERWTLRKANAINAKTRTAMEVIKRFNSRSAKYLIEDAIDPVFMRGRVPPHSETLLFAGNILRRKGIEEWLECFIRLRERHEKLKGCIIGFGKDIYLSKLRRKAREYINDGSLVFTGQMSHQEMAAIYRRGGLFFFPSHVENSPNAVMEGMAAGLPVVCSSVGDAKNIVDHMRSGVIVEKGNIIGMIEALEGILANRELSCSFGKRGREIALSRWQPEIIAEKHVEMYRDILSR